jgi:hypothetical protein
MPGLAAIAIWSQLSVREGSSESPYAGHPPWFDGNAARFGEKIRFIAADQPRWCELRRGLLNGLKVIGNPIVVVHRWDHLVGLPVHAQCDGSAFERTIAIRELTSSQLKPGSALPAYNSSKLSDGRP